MLWHSSIIIWFVWDAAQYCYTISFTCSHALTLASSNSWILNLALQLKFALHSNPCQTDYYGYFNLASCCNYHIIVLLSLCATSESKSLCYITQNFFFFFLRSFLCLHSRANLSYSFLFLPSYNSLPYREKRIELDIKDLVGVLWACTRVHVSTLKIRFFSCNEWIIRRIVGDAEST